MATAEAKQANQAALVAAISTGVHAGLADEFKKLGELLSKQSVTINSTLARLSIVEELLNSGGAAAKRNVRTAPAAGGKKPAAAAAGGKKTAAKPTGQDATRVSNALLFCRYMMANDLDNAREIYGTEENLAEAETDPAVAKKDKVKDEMGYWSAVGAYIWSKVLSDEQKTTIRALYAAWKEEAARTDAEPPLEEDEDA